MHQNVARRRTPTMVTFIRGRPNNRNSPTRSGMATTKTNDASGCMATAPETFPCRRSTAARVEPHVGHGTPRNRLIGQSVTPKTCANAIHPPMAHTANAIRAASEERTPQSTARNHDASRPITKPGARRQRQARRQSQEPLRRRKPSLRTPPPPCNSRMESS